jgi:hypothetical protein
MTDVTTHEEADRFLHTRGRAVPRKKVANNTWLVRGPHTTARYDEIADGDISVVLHNTPVVTYHAEGTLSLNTGGWLTVTTKDRINRFTPPNVRVHSVKGRWMVATGVATIHSDSSAYTTPDWANSVAYADDMVLCESGSGRWVPVTSEDGSTVQAQDAHNTAIRKLITRWLKAYDGPTDDFSHWDIREIERSSCPLCAIAQVDRRDEWISNVVTYGDRMGDTQHLIDHMLDGDCPGALLFAALCAAGYHHPSALSGGSHLYGSHKRVLRHYMTNRLYRGAVASAHGRKPVQA